MKIATKFKFRQLVYINGLSPKKPKEDCEYLGCSGKVGYIFTHEFNERIYQVDGFDRFFYESELISYEQYWINKKLELLSKEK